MSRDFFEINSSLYGITLAHLIAGTFLLSDSYNNWIHKCVGNFNRQYNCFVTHTYIHT